MKGGFNDSRTVYRVDFSCEDVSLHDGSIEEHIHPFKEMTQGGTFEERIYNLYVISGLFHDILNLMVSPENICISYKSMITSFIRKEFAKYVSSKQ